MNCQRIWVVACPVLVILLCVTLRAETAEPESRLWKDASGQFTVEATFLGVADGNVRLKSVDGRTIAVPLGKLSAVDQRWVREYLAAQRTAKVAPTTPRSEGDWLSWRGPNQNGIAAAGQTLPTEWSPSKNVVWQSPVAGRGHSSPIVIGQRVILSTADEQRQVQSVLCFDRQSGRQLWQTDVNQGGFPPQIHAKNTHASPTVASNGQSVFVVFNNHDSVQLAALDLDGKQLWQKSAGAYRPRAYQYGYAPSPLIYQSLVIVTADFEEPGYLAAFNQQNGAEVWRTARPNKVSYSSPIVARVAGRDQLLISGCDVVNSYDPQNGRPLWSANGTSSATCGTMIWEGDLVFASGGYPKAETVAVKADGSGRVVWRNSEKCYEQSMLVHDGFVYAVNDNGIAMCWDVADGTEQWKRRLAGPISASPILAAGNIYATNERGTTFVFRANPKQFELISENQLGDESFATPTICGSQIFLRVATSMSGRRHETLYCLAASDAP